MTGYNLYLKYSYKRINNHLILPLNYLTYLWNQVMTCALQEHEFRHVLQSNIWWFDTLKSTFNLSSKWYWRTLMRHLGLIQHSFVPCKLEAWMKEAWELLREFLCLKRELVLRPSLLEFFFSKVRPSIYWDSQVLSQYQMA